MYNNIGRKIKILAEVLFWVNLACALVIEWILKSRLDISFLLCILLVIAGGIGAYIISLFIYGFGELVENSKLIAESTTEISVTASDLNSRNYIASMKQNNNTKKGDET